MKKIYIRFEETLTKVSMLFAQSTILNIISRAFTMLLPIIMVGSITSLIRGIDFGGYQAFITTSGISSVLGTIYQFTVGLLAVYIVFCMTYQYCEHHDLNKYSVIVGLSAIICFFILTPYTAAPDAYSNASIPTDFLGSGGMFTAIITSFIVGYIYEFCVKRNISIRLPSSVPPAIADQFSALIPSFVCVIIFSLINIAFEMTPFLNAQNAIYSLVRIPLSILTGNLFGLLLFAIAANLSWFFGIHGGMTVMPIMNVLFMQAQMENLAAFQSSASLPNIITGIYVTIGSGSLPLVVAILLFSKSKANKSLGKLGVIPSLFGVDEPVYFGIPMILNPVFFLPWVILIPSMCVLGTYILQLVGFLNNFTGVNAGQFTPFFITNLLGYGMKGLIIGFIFFILSVVIYIPFLKVYDKQIVISEKSDNSEDLELVNEE